MASKSTNGKVVGGKNVDPGIAKCGKSPNRTAETLAKEHEESDSGKENCDAVLVTKFKIGGEEGMESDAYLALQKALDKEQLFTELTRVGQMTIGNR
jgi:hypothetical protein